MSFEDEMRAALATFVVEAREQIQELESGLLRLDQEPEPAETINAVFRAAHTVKGSAGVFGLDHVVRFTHVLESLLDRLRDGEVRVSAELVGALLPCCDHLGSLIAAVEAGEPGESPELSERGAALLAGLRPFSTGGTGGAGGGDAAGGAGTGADAGGRRNLHLSLRFGQECLRNGMDPLSFISYLSTLGQIVSVATLTDLLPPGDQFDPERCYLDFEVTLATDAPVPAVEAVFEFVHDDSAIRVLGPADGPAGYLDLVASAGELGPRIAQILVATGAVDAAEFARAGGVVPAGPPAGEGPAASGGCPGDPAAQNPAGPRGGGTGRSTPVPAGEGPAAGDAGAPHPVTDGSGADGRPGADRRPGADGRPGAARESRSIRIDGDRLDRLIDAVGELVIAGAGVGLRASHNRDETLVTALGEVMRLVEEVRDSALQLRMVPIGTTFSRFQRVVRDVSVDLGKDIALVVSGGDTEVDKALVERISDPLLHLVRNAIDHGIEPAEVRRERGKPVRGTLRLNAFHDSGSIVIEVSDDGGGIDGDRVLARAVERGLVEPGANLTEQEVYGLIFEPGFSTAETVSDLSGRGVGMDVVKRNVTALRGTIDVENHPDEGCTIRIRLPLTLAIIDGFLVGIGDATFVVPLDQVIECVELPAGSDTRDCMDLRGEVMPFIRLRSLFTIDGARPRRENVVVVEYAGSKVGLVVDALMGEFQTVIKPLGRLFEHVQGIGGSTILGNGDVALIIDVPVLVRHYGDRQGVGQLIGATRD